MGSSGAIGGRLTGDWLDGRVLRLVGPQTTVWWLSERRSAGGSIGGAPFWLKLSFLLQDCSSVVSQELFCIPLLWYVGDGLPNLWCPSIGCYVALPLLYHLGTFCRGKLEGIERHGWRGVQIVDCGEGLQEEEIWFFVFPISFFFISYFFILIKENDISIFKNKTKRILLVFKENTQD